MNTVFRPIYPSLVGLLLGLLQTGLFFQLSFTLSSSFRTFLMITVCWLLGSVVGLQFVKQTAFPLNGFTFVALVAYFACCLLVMASPFNTQIWPAYALLILITGLYPGAFFATLSKHYSASTLFFRENNGFIMGLVSGTILFLVMGRIALWVLPIFVAGLVILCTRQVLVPHQETATA